MFTFENRFVYQVVVPRSLADKDFVEILDKGDATTFPPWDPMVRLSSLFYMV